MFFRLALALLLMVTTSCARENISRQQPIKVRLKSGGDCFSQLRSRFAAFQEGTISDEDLDATWTCLERAVQDFERLTNGDLPQGHYSPAAVGGFLRRYFAPQRPPVPTELLSHAMHLKRALIGGREDVLTRDELARIRQLFAVAREASFIIKAHAAILFLRQPQSTLVEVDRAATSLAQAAQVTTEWLSKNGHDLDLRRAGQFAVEVGAWMAQPDLDQSQDRSRAWRVLPPLKRLILNGDANIITVPEWRRALPMLTTAYSAILRLRTQARGDFGLGSEAWPRLLVDFSTLLREVIGLKPSGKLPLSELRDVFNELEGAGLLVSTNAEQLTAFVGWILGRLIKGEASLEFIGPSELNALQTRAETWRAWLVGVDLHQAPPELVQNRERSSAMEWDDLGRLRFAGVESSWSLAAQKRLASAQFVLSWLLHSFGLEAPVTASAVAALAREITERMQSIGLNLPANLGTRLLREADLFTLSSNGDGRLDMHEASRYVLSLMSALNAALVWSEGCEAPITPACLLERLQTRPVVRAPLPLAANDLVREKYFNAALLTIKPGGMGQAPALLDVLQIWMLFQYVETFQQRFDIDRGGTIQLSEAMTSYGVFGPTLIQMLEPRGMNPEAILGFFTFLLKFGETPFTMFGGSIAFDWWLWHQDRWEIAADRQILMSLLQALAQL